MFSPRLRKVALVVHVVTSVGWLGAVAASLALAISGLATDDAVTARGIYAGLDLEVRYVLVPLAVLSLASGVIQSLGTPWGLVRHYWVLIKLVITAFATVVLVLQVAPIRALGRAAVAGPLGPNQMGERASVLVHSGAGLLVLLVPTVLSVFKPRGLTRYGWAKGHQERTPVASLD